MKYMIKILVCVCVAAFLTGNALAGERSFKPEIISGSQWAYRAIYPDRSHPGQDLTPVFWDVTVKGAENIRKEQCWKVEISPRFYAVKDKAIVWLRQTDLSVISIESQKKARGKLKRRSSATESPIPYVSVGTAAPVDFPVFPVVISEKKEFQKKIILTGGIYQLTTYIQETSACSADQIKALGLPEKNTEQYIQIICRTGEGDPLFMQVWDTDLGVPVFGQNNNMKYWLDF